MVIYLLLTTCRLPGIQSPYLQADLDRNYSRPENLHVSIGVSTLDGGFCKDYLRRQAFKARISSTISGDFFPIFFGCLLLPTLVGKSDRRIS